MSSILHKPIITEKANTLQERFKQYGFIVDKHATKDEIRLEIEKIYNVEVDQIRTMIYAGRKKFRYTRRKFTEGRTPAFKKAFVTLKADQEIDFYANI